MLYNLEEPRRQLFPATVSALCRIDSVQSESFPFPFFSLVFANVPATDQSRLPQGLYSCRLENHRFLDHSSLHARLPMPLVQQELEETVHADAALNRTVPGYGLLPYVHVSMPRVLS